VAECRDPRLIDPGHRRIGIIAEPDYATSSLGRLSGYLQAIEEAGIEKEPRLIVPSSFSIESGETAAEALLALSEPPTAIFAINVNTAIGTMSAIARAGLAVPGDISLVGYNDIPVVTRLPVPPDNGQGTLRPHCTGRAATAVRD
jgi:LacI family transcriptional regulator